MAGLLLCGLPAAGRAVPPAGPEFQPALPGYRFSFPRDHAGHPAFKTEWWYYTGHLQAADGRRFGYQLTFFRSGVSRVGAAQRPSRPGTHIGVPLQSRWRYQDLYLAHFAVSDESGRRFRFFERLNRPGLGMAEARTDRYRVVNGAWEAELRGQDHLLQAGDEAVRLDLRLRPLKPPVIHGHDGVSVKGDCPGCASHYYSLTRLQTSGTLAVNGEQLAVQGLSWMDHEFGSNQLAPELAGWDWFSVQLDSGSELMLYHLRRADGTPIAQSSGTWVRPDGTWKYLPKEAFNITPQGSWRSPRSRGRYPMGWTVRVPGEQLELHLTPTFPDQELVTALSTGVTYWEGSAAVQGLQRGKEIKGDAYVEMTGYAERFRQRI